MCRSRSSLEDRTLAVFFSRLLLLPSWLLRSLPRLPRRAVTSLAFAWDRAVSCWVERVRRILSFSSERARTAIMKPQVSTPPTGRNSRIGARTVIHGMVKAIVVPVRPASIRTTLSRTCWSATCSLVALLSLSGMRFP